AGLQMQDIGFRRLLFGAGRLDAHIFEARLVLKGGGHRPKCKVELVANKDIAMPEGPITTIIREKLTAALSPERLEIVDDSGRHAGHHHDGGMDGRPGGESHFNLTVVA